MSRDNIPAAHGALNMMLIAVCYQVTVVGYALVVVLSHFKLVANLGGGLMILLLYGTLVNGVLTAGMLCLMFLPNAARKLTGGVLRVLVRLRLVRNETVAREKLERQLAEYRRVQSASRPIPAWCGPAGAHLPPADCPVCGARDGVLRLRPHRQQRGEHHLYPGVGDTGSVQPAPAGCSGRL